jgi:8-oxo-dGTP diphosphatase
VLLDVFSVTRWSGRPYGREGQPIEWVAFEELRSRDLPPADRPILTALDLPDRYLVTPEPPEGDPAGEAVFLARLGAALGRGTRLVQLRAKAPGPGFSALAARAAAVCASGGARLLVNAPAGTSFEPADGVHLSVSRLRARRGPVPGEGVVGVSCHDAGELAHAAEAGADFAVLGPVAATASHPGTAALGWNEFEALVAEAAIPVYALGGMTLADIDAARRRGGQGIAAIRGLWEV